METAIVMQITITLSPMYLLMGMTESFKVKVKSTLEAKVTTYSFDE
jgi:hypothetical protein